MDLNAVVPLRRVSVDCNYIVHLLLYYVSDDWILAATVLVPNTCAHCDHNDADNSYYISCIALYPKVHIVLIDLVLGGKICLLKSIS